MQEFVPLFGVPENFLLIEDGNLLPHLTMDICKFLGIYTLNTTAYHSSAMGWLSI